MTTTTERLTAADARKLTARIRDALAVADGLLVTLWRGRGWEALGYPAGALGWAAYCAAELPELQLLALRAEPRDEKIRGMHREGMSLGAIATGLRVSKSTAHAAVSTMPDRPATVAALDGRRRTAVVPPVTPGDAALVQPFTAALVALLAARGPLTCAQVERLTKRHHGAVSAALHRLTIAGRVSYTPGARRGLTGVYSAAQEALR